MALAKHASELTSHLFAALQLLDDLDPMKPIIEGFVECVVHSLMRLFSPINCRTLQGIAAFSKKRAERSTLGRWRKKQSDMDDIRKWDTELTRAFERFNVCVRGNWKRQLPLNSQQINALLELRAEKKEHYEKSMSSHSPPSCEK
jgi:hypothetical protein